MILSDIQEERPATESQESPEPQEIMAAGPTPAESKLNFYDLIYGMLFEPAVTISRVVKQPPVPVTVAVVLVMNFVTMLTALYSAGRSFNQSGLPWANLRSMAPLLAFLGLFLQFVKWFGYSAVLHLIADFYGGRGQGRVVFTLYGLAELPQLFLIPIQVLMFWVSPGVAGVITALTCLAVAVWGLVLLVMGIREAHGFSTGRAVAVVFTPLVALVIGVIILIIGLASFMAALLPLAKGLMPG